MQITAAHLEALQKAGVTMEELTDYVAVIESCIDGALDYTPAQLVRDVQEYVVHYRHC
jgi:hypothetical protein